MSNSEEKIDENGSAEVRTVSPVYAERAKNNLDTPKMLGVAAVIIVFGFLAVRSMFTGDDATVDETAADNSDRISVSQQYTPVEVEPVQPVEAVVEPKKGPIEIARQEAVEPPAPPTREEQMIESSKRAPLMAFAAPLDKRSTQTDTTAENNGFSSSDDNGSRKVTTLDPITGIKIPNPHLMLTKGSNFSCSLDTAMDSTLGGDVVCPVNRDVYGRTGAVILLPQGTRIVGEYKGGLKRGEKRLFVMWTRAETPAPDHVLINLDSKATDALGRTGFDGNIDTQFWTRFGGTLMLSVIGDAINYSTRNSEEDYETTDGVSNLAETELNSVINIPVILTKNQGEIVGITLSNDLDFSTVYELEITR